MRIQKQFVENHLQLKYLGTCLINAGMGDTRLKGLAGARGARMTLINYSVNNLPC